MQNCQHLSNKSGSRSGLVVNTLDKGSNPGLDDISFGQIKMNDLEMNINGEGVKKRIDFETITESEDPVVVAWVVRA